MHEQDARLGRVAFWATVAAFLWGVALVISAFLVPAYNSGATLIDVNGPGALIPVGVPALVAALVGLALHHKCATGSKRSGYAAGVLAAVLAAFSVVAMFSIGIFVLPVAVLLTIATVLTPSGAARIGLP